MTRVLVTGAGGFVGRHLVAHLREVGDEVVGIDRECDVTDREAVARRVGDAAPEVVVHLAALAHVGESWADPEGTWRVNVGGTANVLAAARGVDALVLVVSSADVYGVVAESDLPLGEDHPVAPVSPYARSKREAELVALDAVRTLGQRAIVVRPFNHVGPGQASSFVVPALASRLLAARAEGRGEIAVGDLSTRRDFCDVRDVVRAYRLLVDHGRVGEIYHVASGRDVALSDVAAQLVEMIAPGTRLVEDPSLRRPVEVPALRGSPGKIHRATGWEAGISLSTSLRDVVAWLSSRPRGRAGP